MPSYWLSRVEWTDMAEMFRASPQMADITGVPVLAWQWPGADKDAYWPKPAAGWRVRSATDASGQVGLQAVYSARRAEDDVIAEEAATVELQDPEAVEERAFLRARGLGGRVL